MIVLIVLGLVIIGAAVLAERLRPRIVRYKRTGRHRGRFGFEIPWPRNIMPGWHRGKYQPQPAWARKPKSVHLGALLHNTKIYGITPQNDVQPMMILPPDWHNWTAEDHGRFGDLDIDRADQAPVRPFAPDGTIDHRALQKEGWCDLGTVDTVE